MLPIIQVADSLGTAGTTDVGILSGSLTFLASLASIVGLVFTIWSLRLARKSLRDAKEAQEKAKVARSEAETLRDQYARKQRLPQLRDELETLATELDIALNDFPEREGSARELAARIHRTMKTVLGHLDGESHGEVEQEISSVQIYLKVNTLKDGQKIRSGARVVALLLTHFIDDEKAKSV